MEGDRLDEVAKRDHCEIDLNPNYALGHNLLEEQTKARLCLAGRRCGYLD